MKDWAFNLIQKIAKCDFLLWANFIPWFLQNVRQVEVSVDFQ